MASRCTSQACAAGFPRRIGLREGIRACSSCQTSDLLPNSEVRAEHAQEILSTRCSPSHLLSHAVLQSLHSEGLDNSACWLRLDLHQFAESHPLAGFRRWLMAGLDHAHSWKCELTSFF